jgi:hypothetical protein
MSPPSRRRYRPIKSESENRNDLSARVTGSPDVDARSYTRVDANTLITASTKAGKLVQVTTLVLSQEGKTITTTESTRQDNR